MKILLFGPAGQVGGRLKQLLGDDCIALTRGHCDLETLTQAQAKELIAQHAPDCIVNAAGFTAVDAAQQQYNTAMRVNAEAPAILARAAGGIPFLHLSTDYVFDGKRGPYREDDEPAPLNRYGESKREAERRIAAAGGRFYIFRLQWIYDTRGANFYLTMKKLLAERTHLRVVADQFGAPSTAGDVARTLTRALPLIRDGSMPSGIYHLAAGGHTSWHGFAATIALAMDGRAAEQIEPITSAEYPTPAERPHDTRLDCSKLAAHGITMPHWRAGFDALMEE